MKIKKIFAACWKSNISANKWLKKSSTLAKIRTTEIFRHSEFAKITVLFIKLKAKIWQICKFQVNTLLKILGSIKINLNKNQSTWWANSWATIRPTITLSVGVEIFSSYKIYCNLYVTRPQFSMAPEFKSGIAIESENILAMKLFNNFV